MSGLRLPRHAVWLKKRNTDRGWGCIDFLHCSYVSFSPPPPLRRTGMRIPGTTSIMGTTMNGPHLAECRGLVAMTATAGLCCIAKKGALTERSSYGKSGSGFRLTRRGLLLPRRAPREHGHTPATGCPLTHTQSSGYKYPVA